MPVQLCARRVMPGVSPLRLWDGMNVMSKSTLTAIALALFLIGQCYSMSGLKAQPFQSSERDLSRYDRIGPFNVPVGENPSTVSAKVRDFIWEHWEQHRLGYAVVTFHSKEGEPSTSHIFVEPDESGVWHLSVSIERELIDRRGWSDPKYRGKKIHQTDSYKAYAIKRLPDKDSYHLRLKDKDGKVITEW